MEAAQGGRLPTRVGRIGFRSLKPQQSKGGDFPLLQSGDTRQGGRHILRFPHGYVPLDRLTKSAKGFGNVIRVEGQVVRVVKGLSPDPAEATAVGQGGGDGGFVVRLLGGDLGLDVYSSGTDLRD